jgi:hypothetical protein
MGLFFVIGTSAYAGSSYSTRVNTFENGILCGLGIG